MTVDPNAIDPDAFYDATGRLWMVYGSYSGGIYILELDPATGKPKAGQAYYGKHLVGGGHAPIEGPYIQYSPESGQQFLIFHTRFPGKGEFHQLRVHEMFVNLDGWLVAAPLRHAPRKNSSGLPQAMVEYVGLGEVGGSYQMVNHGRDMAGTAKTSVAVTLDANGTVSGGMSGTWTFGGNNVIALTLGSNVFTDVLSRQWSEAAQKFRVTLTALDAAGESLWGVHDG